MFRVDNLKNIYITRGDSANILLTISQGVSSNPSFYTMLEGDVAKLFIHTINEKDTSKSILTKEVDLSALLTKDSETEPDVLNIKIDPNEINLTNFPNREYQYQVKLYTNYDAESETWGNVDTIVPVKYLYVED